MNAEQNVTSLELSKKLKATGAVEGSALVWERTGPTWQHYQLAENIGMSPLDRAAAFNCYELFERLPPYCAVEKCVRIYQATQDFNTRRRSPFNGNTPAEALGKLLLWCYENGHMEEQ